MENSLTAFGKPVFYTIHEGFFAEVGEFAGIEEGSFAGGAAFELDMGLFPVVNLEHTDVADGAVDVPLLIEFSGLFGISGINFNGSIGFAELFGFEGIESQAAAIFALVVFDSLVLSFSHVMGTFRTVHGISFCCFVGALASGQSSNLFLHWLFP